MAFTLTRSFNTFRTKFLLSKLFNTQCNWNILSIDCQTLSYRTHFVKVHWSFTNFRSMSVSEQLQNEIKKVTITFVRHDGVRFKRVAPVDTEMNTLYDWKGPEFPGFGLCGGVQECGTCQIKFPLHLRNKQEDPTNDEFEALVRANEYDKRVSRLGCCLTVTEEMDGAVLYIPKIVYDIRDRD